MCFCIQEGTIILLSSFGAGWGVCLPSFLSPPQTRITNLHWMALKHQLRRSRLHTHTHSHTHADESGSSHIPRTPEIHFSNCTKTLPKTQLRPVCGRRIVKNPIMLESRNYEWRSICWGALADGKLWVRAGGPATFIDFQVYLLQVSSSPNLDFFDWIVRLESFDIRPAFLGYVLSRATWSSKEMAFL